MAQLFPHAVIMSAYGMTEAASSITFATLRHPPHLEQQTHSHQHAQLLLEHQNRQQQLYSHQQQRQESQHSHDCQAVGNHSHAHSNHASTPTGAVCVGFPGPGVAVSIRALENGAGVGSRSDSEGPSDSSSGQVGEVCVRGRCVMDGYWRAPRETAEVRHGRQAHSAQGLMHRREANEDSLSSHVAQLTALCVCSCVQAFLPCKHGGRPFNSQPFLNALCALVHRSSYRTKMVAGTGCARVIWGS